LYFLGEYFLVVDTRRESDHFLNSINHDELIVLDPAYDHVKAVRTKIDGGDNFWCGFQNMSDVESI